LANRVVESAELTGKKRCSTNHRTQYDVSP
jgi:hypothetical protein